MRNRMSLTSCIVWAGLVALTVLGVLGLKPIPQGAGSEVMLLEDLGPGSTQDLGARLSSEGVTVLENYGSFALVSITQEQRGELEREHLRVSDLPDRTRTGRGSIFFDSRNGEPVLPANLQADLRGADLDRHYIVQLIGPIKQAWLQNLESVGVELFDYLPSYSFVVAMPPRTVEQVRKLPFVQWVGIYHPGYKLTRALLEPKTGNRMVLVLLFPRQSSSRVESLLASWGAAVAEHWSDSAATGLRVAVASERF